MLWACMEETSFNVTSSIFIPVVDHYLKICLSSSYIPTGSTKTNASGASPITNTDYLKISLKYCVMYLKSFLGEKIPWKLT